MEDRDKLCKTIQELRDALTLVRILTKAELKAKDKLLLEAKRYLRQLKVSHGEFILKNGNSDTVLKEMDKIQALITEIEKQGDITNG